MAGLTKAQRAEKEAAKAPTATEIVEEKVEAEKKYRYQFKSYAEYFKYDGPKG